MFQSQHPHPGTTHPRFSWYFWTGNEQVIRLLKAAFTQRLIFKVDTDNTVVWNIYHG